jgi:hypothetical protein
MGHGVRRRQRGDGQAAAPAAARWPAAARSAAGQIEKPTCSASLLLPAWRLAPSRPALICGTSYATELYISRLADSQVGEQPDMSPLSPPRYPQRGTLITTPEWLILARCGMRSTPCSSWRPGRIVIRAWPCVRSGYHRRGLHPDDRTRAIGAWAGLTAVAAAVGPPAGGDFEDPVKLAAGFPVAMTIAAGASFAAAVLAWTTIRDDALSRPRADTTSVAKELPPSLRRHCAVAGTRWPRPPIPAPVPPADGQEVVTACQRNVSRAGSHFHLPAN